MKNTIKNITILVFTIMTFASCHKDKDNNSVHSKAHKARYEVVSLGDKPANLELIYITQHGIGYGNGLEVKQETNVTPWQHEFTFYNPFAFELFANSESEDINDRMPIKAYLYIDDELVIEQENNQYFDINIYYSYLE